VVRFVSEAKHEEAARSGIPRPCRRLIAARSSGFPFVADSDRRLARDLDAVRLSIAVPWSNGPIEGHINRLKVIKRQMYGRAGFDLLKVRVMPFVEPSSSTEIA